MLPPGLHSQQAGTILPTLMRIPRAMPPCDGHLPLSGDYPLGFMCSARLRYRLGSHAFHWFQS